MQSSIHEMFLHTPTLEPQNQFFIPESLCSRRLAGPRLPRGFAPERACDGSPGFVEEPRPCLQNDGSSVAVHMLSWSSGSRAKQQSRHHLQHGHLLCHHAREDGLGRGIVVATMPVLDLS